MDAARIEPAVPRRKIKRTEKLKKIFFPVFINTKNLPFVFIKQLTHY
jgi:hypothetical protein